MLFTWLTLTGFILLLTPQSITGKLQGAFSQIFSMPLKIGRSISLSAKMPQTPVSVYKRKTIQYENYIVNLNEQLLEKQKQIELLSGMKNRFYALEGAKLLSADIIKADLKGSLNELEINRGKSDGIYEGFYVLADNSIIGVISNTFSRTSKVRLLTDTDSKIPVKIKGLNSKAWMHGNGDGTAKIKSLKKHIETGEDIIAEKQPGYLDAPMIAGKAIDISRNEQLPLLWDITVKPACNLQRLTNVTVIIMNPQDD